MTTTPTKETTQTREYPKNNDPAHKGVHEAQPREKTVSELHDDDIAKAKAEIAALVEKARAVRAERDRSSGAAHKPEYQLIAELQDIFRQVHKLNAKWLADRGYEYTPPPVPEPEPAPPVEPGAAPVEPKPIAT